MLLQPSWLSTLLFIALSAALVRLPGGLKPRYLATGTGISQPSATAPPYPTGTANGTALSTGPTTATSTATPTPISPSELFNLVVAAAGTPYDGQYLSVGSSTSRNGLLVLYPDDAPNQVARYSTFNVNADGTLQNEFIGGIANIFPGGDTYNTPFFRSEAYVEQAGNIKSICGVVGGTLECRTGADTVFFICPPQVISGTLTGGTVDVGPMTEPGCTPITLLVVPV